MKLEEMPHSAETRALATTVGEEVQRFMRANIDRHESLDGGPSAIIEGALFGFCCIAFDGRPDGVSADDLVTAITEQARRYLTHFEAEASIGSPQGTA